MVDLHQFIHTCRDSRELKRALAVQNTLAGRSWAEVATELGVQTSFINKWRWRYKQQGIQCLRLAYKGRSSYLTPAEKKSVITWIQQQSSWNLYTLYRHIADTYDVRYKSPQSYYTFPK